MWQLLDLEADFKTIQIVYNSLEDPKNKRIRIRELLCPCVGRLYPLYYYNLKGVEALDDLRDVLRPFDRYRKVLADIPEPNKNNHPNMKSLEDCMYEEQVRQWSYSFDQQNNLSIFYSYFKLKEQEIRNLIWLAEMISRKLDKNSSNWHKIIVPFNSEI